MSLLGSYAVVTSDKHGTILSANQSAVKLFGYAQEELVGTKVNILMAPPYSDQHDAFLARYKNTKEPHVIGKTRAVTGLNKEGETINLKLSLSEAETARGSLFIALFEQAPDTRVIVDTNLTGEIFGIKGNLFLTLGYHKEEILGNNISQLCFTQDSPFMPICEGDTYPNDSKIIGKIRTTQAKHKTKPHAINISLLVKKATLRIRSADGESSNIPGFRSIITPIDDVETMVVLSLSGEILSASADFYHLFGYTEEEIAERSITSLVKCDVREILPSERVPRTKKRVKCIHQDKSVFTADISIELCSNPEEDAKYQEDVFICKISRASSKKKDKESSHGTTMGLYTYGKVLGSGYFGKVRMARHRLTGERVAIKTLRKKQYLAVNMEYPPREISVLKSLDHPNINRLYDTVIETDRIHLILEHVEGRELCEIVETENIPEEVCRHLWRQILTGISYMHTNGVVHRDLKLENIIIDKTGFAKIIDMGFGNFVLNPSHLLRTFCGSPDYAAPELFLGKAYNGFHADCWSLGVLLFAMLTGLLPFKDSQSAMKGAYQFPSSVSEGARDLIKRILVKESPQRLTVNDMLAHPWTNVGYSGPPPQPISLFNSKIDNDILQEMENLGMDSSTVKTSIERREFNQFTTTYFLLLQAKIRKLSGQEGTPKAKSKKRGGDECALL
uniref:non-specific serine/threonine protein kinase n=1 Tax=Vannella robusta TaxID=1487602 RepID=A0A7S4HJC5_9EUKA|mmetsp:Transcript_11472/g.14185  ORF Transcript_11472/g.14185 Transcript_11472/m.14185 type:complete len:676 (+) Transcript_11472:30-2057(+)